MQPGGSPRVPCAALLLVAVAFEIGACSGRVEQADPLDGGQIGAGGDAGVDPSDADDPILDVADVPADVEPDREADNDPVDRPDRFDTCTHTGAFLVRLWEAELGLQSFGGDTVGFVVGEPLPVGTAVREQSDGPDVFEQTLERTTFFAWLDDAPGSTGDRPGRYLFCGLGSDALEVVEASGPPQLDGLSLTEREALGTPLLRLHAMDRRDPELPANAVADENAPLGDYGDAPDDDEHTFPSRFDRADRASGGHTLDTRFEWIADGDPATRDVTDERGVADPDDPDARINLVNGDSDDVKYLVVELRGLTATARVLFWLGLSEDAPPGPRYLNLVADLNADGDWDDQAPVDEWLLRNDPIEAQVGDEVGRLSGPFRIDDGRFDIPDVWNRLLLTRTPIDGAALVNGHWDGSGAFAYGEIEDGAPVLVGFDGVAPFAPPEAPSGLVAVAGDGLVTLSWTPIFAADTYTLYWSIDPPVSLETATVVADVSSPFEHTGLTNGTTYYYRLTGSTRFGEGPPSDEVSATPMVPLPAPDNLVATPGPESVALSWDPVPDASSYYLYWGTAAGVAPETGLIIEGVASPYVHAERQSGTTYYYIVTASNAFGMGPPSAEAFATAGRALPDPPTGVAAAPGPESITVSWDEVLLADTYNLYWSTTPGLTPASGTVIAGVDSPFTHTERTPATPVYYVVTGENESGEGLPSSEVFAAAGPAIPAPPGGVMAEAAHEQVTITWDSVDNADGYNLYWSTTSGVTSATGTLIADVSSAVVHDGLTNGTTYYYVVTAVNESGEGAESVEVSATPLPPVPEAPTSPSAAPGPGTVLVAWNDVAFATAYNLYWSNAPGVTPLNGTLLEDVSSPFLHGGRSGGETVYYVVTASNVAGESAPSAEVFATALPPIPAPPTNVAATTGFETVVLAWDPVPEATTYTLYWSTSPGVTPATGTPIAGVLSPYTHAGRTNGVTYYYVVTASNVTGESLPSAQVFATPVPPIPDAPENVAAELGPLRVTVSWDDVPFAGSYNLYWSTTDGVTPGAGTQIADVDSPYVHDGRTEGTTYYYVVTAANVTGEGPPSAQVSAVAGPPIPAAPANLTATTASQTVVLSWDDAADATSYNLYRAEQPGVTPEDGELIEDVTSPHTDSGLVNFVTYYYVVAGVNVSGQGPPSNEASGLPMPSAPAAPTGVAAVAGMESIEITWDDVPGATSYNIYWSLRTNVSQFGGTGTPIVGVTSPYLHSPLPDGRPHYYVVTAENAFGESPDSEGVWATPLLLDTDMDCIPDVIEIAMGYLPGDEDTDNDGILDGDEELDGDGLINCTEVLFGTSPIAWDTDGDGLSDAEEIGLGLDPLDPDMDDDGGNDGWELANGTDPLDPTSGAHFFGVTRDMRGFLARGDPDDGGLQADFAITLPRPPRAFIAESVDASALQLDFAASHESRIRTFTAESGSSGGLSTDVAIAGPQISFCLEPPDNCDPLP